MYLLQVEPMVLKGKYMSHIVPPVEIFHILSLPASLPPTPLFSPTWLSNKASLCVRRRVNSFDVPASCNGSAQLIQKASGLLLDFENNFPTLSHVEKRVQKKGIGINYSNELLILNSWPRTGDARLRQITSIINA